MSEGLYRRRKPIGTVLHQTEIPPALCPIGFELRGLTVEFDGLRDVLLVAGSGRTAGKVFELRGCLLSVCEAETGSQKEREKHSITLDQISLSTEIGTRKEESWSQFLAVSMVGGTSSTAADSA